MYDDSLTAPFLAKDVDKFWYEDIYQDALRAVENSDADTLEGFIRAEGMPVGKVMNLIRLALTGSSSGLGIHDMMTLIGKGETLSRLHYIKERLG